MCAKIFHFSNISDFCFPLLWTIMNCFNYKVQTKSFLRPVHLHAIPVSRRVLWHCTKNQGYFHLLKLALPRSTGKTASFVLLYNKLQSNRAGNAVKFSWFISPFHWSDSCRSETSTPGYLRKTNMCFATLSPPGLQVSLCTDGARTGNEARQSLNQALELSHLPRETSALHNVTLENKRLHLMCLWLSAAISQEGESCPFAALTWTPCLPFCLRSTGYNPLDARRRKSRRKSVGISISVIWGDIVQLIGTDKTQTNQRITTCST